MARAVTLLVVAVVLALSLWFSAAAVMPGLAAEHGTTLAALAGLTTATQLGFVAGALSLAATGLPDRRDPRVVFAASAVVAAGANAGLLVLHPEGWAALASRFIVGAGLAGVYPVGLKIAVGWSEARRGLITGFLVGAVTLGSGLPHLVVLTGGPDWRATIVATSALALLAAALVFGVGLGPFHRRAARLRLGVLGLAWSDRRIRLAFAGYFGHMWELYAFWAWVAAIAAASSGAVVANPRAFGAAVAFAAITLGGLACVPAGWFADRIGRARIAGGAMVISAAAGLASAIGFGGAPVIVAALLVVWGSSIVADSAQFSSLVADNAPAESAGSLMALQTALGFALSALTVQLLPWFAGLAGWPFALAALAIGPILGAAAMGRLDAMGVRRPAG
ncbi:MFS transporter [Elioraea rosea]|uniref:MFS transporter n=1 Tax=Elioraea rosea TaxID=2492390 RepID=UPI001182313C|nr:MFS transporter [Elioraea rosea]